MKSTAGYHGFEYSTYYTGNLTSEDELELLSTIAWVLGIQMHEVGLTRKLRDEPQLLILPSIPAPFVTASKSVGKWIM